MTNEEVIPNPGKIPRKLLLLILGLGLGLTGLWYLRSCPRSASSLSGKGRWVRRYVGIDVLENGIALGRLDFVMALGAQATADEATGDIWITKPGRRLHLRLNDGLMEVNRRHIALPARPRIYRTSEYVLEEYGPFSRGWRFGNKLDRHMTMIATHEDDDGHTRGTAEWNDYDRPIVPIRPIVEALDASVAFRVSNSHVLPEGTQWVPFEYGSGLGLAIDSPVIERRKSSHPRAHVMTDLLPQRVHGRVRLQGVVTSLDEPIGIRSNVTVTVENAGQDFLLVTDAALWVETADHKLHGGGIADRFGSYLAILAKGRAYELEGTIKGNLLRVIYADGWRCLHWKRQTGRWIAERL